MLWIFPLPADKPCSLLSSFTSPPAPTQPHRTHTSHLTALPSSHFQVLCPDAVFTLAPSPPASPTPAGRASWEDPRLSRRLGHGPLPDPHGGPESHLRCDIHPLLLCLLSRLSQHPQLTPAKSSACDLGQLWGRRAAGHLRTWVPRACSLTLPFTGHTRCPSTSAR